MKLTIYGFYSGLLRCSSVFSVLGIVVSIMGIIGGIFYIVYFESLFRNDSLMIGLSCAIGGVLIMLMISYLIMWILLKIKSSKQDIPGIEKIAKVYTYLSGSLEIMIASIRIITSIIRLTPFHSPFFHFVFAKVYLVWNYWIGFTIVLSRLSSTSLLLFSLFHTHTLHTITYITHQTIWHLASTNGPGRCSYGLV